MLTLWYNYDTFNILILFLFQVLAIFVANDMVYHALQSNLVTGQDLHWVYTYLRICNEYYFHDFVCGFGEIFNKVREQR